MNIPVSFEFAVMLKEKGFNAKVRSMYCEGLLHIDTNSKGNYNDVKWVRTWRNSSIDDTLSAPTISEVVMWLYEKHGIWIEVYIDDDSTFGYLISEIDKDGRYDFPMQRGFSSPKEAYESGIEHVLKTL